jgi:hypothetical protein
MMLSERVDERGDLLGQRGAVSAPGQDPIDGSHAGTTLLSTPD